MDATNQVTDELKSIMQVGRSMMNGADISADNVGDSVDVASDMVGDRLDAIQKKLETMSKTMKTISDGIVETGTTTSKTVGMAKDAMVELKKGFDEIPGLPADKDQVDKDFDKVIADLEALQNATDVTVEDTKGISKQLEKDFSNAAYATIRSFMLKFEKPGLLDSVQYGNRTKYWVAYKV